MRNNFVVAVDYDDTCVIGDYPQQGTTIPDAVESLKLFDRMGMKIILLTLREGDALQTAMEWFQKYEIPLYDINNNPDFPGSRKVAADIYIDDKNADAAIVKVYSGKWILDWEDVTRKVIRRFFQSKERVKNGYSQI
ncbi:MAG: hypothetical protein Q4D62_12415 [Planctomycetia bacterium]|nr:hypothetical protein [Planctomycetia bacterium]